MDTVENFKVLSCEDKISFSVPKLFATSPSNFTESEFPAMEDVRPYESIRELPFNFIDREIGILIGMNLPRLSKPLEVVNTSGSGIFAMHYLLGWAVMRSRSSVYHGEDFVPADYGDSAQYGRIGAKIDAVFSSHLVFHDDEGIGPSQEEAMWERRVAEGKKVVDNLNPRKKTSRAKKKSPLHKLEL